MKKIALVILNIFIGLSTPLITANITTSNFEDQSFYAITSPYNEGRLQVSEVHQLYYCEFGNPEGIPILVLHGGPGGGCSATWSKFFNPKIYHVVMFDQRGAMRSTPLAEMEGNRTDFLIEDIEKLRTLLNIDHWTLFGGSWGSALALLYSEAYPERVSGLILRGVFLAREQDYKHLFYGMKETFPDAWDDMIQTLGVSEDSDLIEESYPKVMDPDPSIHMNVARAFMRFDTLCAFLLPNQEALDEIEQNDQITLGVARAFIHYSKKHFFVKENQIFNDLEKIAHIPTIIVQGRYDLICPMQQAYDLQKRMPNSELWIVPNAGHSSDEIGIAKGLTAAADRIMLRKPA